MYAHLPTKMEEKLVKQILDTIYNSLISIWSCYSRKQYSDIWFFQIISPPVEFLSINKTTGKKSLIKNV